MCVNRRPILGGGCSGKGKKRVITMTTIAIITKNQNFEKRGSKDPTKKREARESSQVTKKENTFEKTKCSSIDEWKGDWRSLGFLVSLLCWRLLVFGFV